MILRKQFLAHVAQTSPSPMLVEVARAEGSFFYTPEGKRYFDLVAGVSVSNVGHGNPAVVRAVQEQAARYMHVMVYGELVETPQVEYAARIASLLPAPLESVYFVNSGAEAVEGALKLAKRFTRRTEIVSMRRAYHGSTHGAMSMMGAPEGEEWKGAFRPLLPDVQAVEFNDFSELERITRRTACVLAEPVQGEAVAALKGAGYRIVATTPHREDATPETFDVGRGPFALVFGTEHAGISDEVIASADEFLRIPMCGMVESLNVSASAAILIYTLSERMRLTVGNWRMSDAEQAETLCRWMRRSVKDSEAILQRRGMVPDL